MARILVNSNRSETLDLEDNLKSMGHQVLYTNFHDLRAVERAKELGVDLFFMHIPSENLTFQKEDNDNNLNWYDIFNSNIPVIPVIDTSEKFDYNSFEKILSTSPHYLLKQEITNHSVDKLKFTIDMVMCKQSRPDKELNSDLSPSGDEEIFRTLYNKVPLPYHSLDENGCFIEVNQIWLNTMGYSREEVIGKWFLNFLAPDSSAYFKKNFPRFLAAGEIHGVELQMVKKDGTTIHVFYEGKIEYDEQGRFKRTHCVFKDITLRKQTEEALTESEEKFRTFIQQSMDGIVLLDEEGHIIEWNQGHEIITGIKKDEVIGKLYWEVKYQLTPPQRRSLKRLKHIMNLQLEALKTGSAPFLRKIHETDLIRPDGEIRYVEQLAFPIKTCTGYRIGYVTRDVTQRKQMEEALDKRIVALSRPLDNPEDISFQDLFNLREIQEIQDLFAEATGVGSIIISPDGRPLTKPSNFCTLCTKMMNNGGIKGTCYDSEGSVEHNSFELPDIRTCHGGLWEANANISIGGKHIANWLIGQARGETQQDNKIKDCAKIIGLDPEGCVKAFHEVPIIPKDQFKKITRFSLHSQTSYPHWHTKIFNRPVSLLKEKKQNVPCSNHCVKRK